MPSPELRLLVLKTGRLEEVRAFYQALGIEFAEEKHGEGPRHFAGNLGPVVMEINPLPEGGLPDASTRIGFAVGDMAKVLGYLQALSAPIVHPPRQTPWGMRALVRDPDGRRVELYQRE